MVKLHTNFGVITLELFADKAPETVENFKQYVRDGHYDNTIFHRVINNFMIQGGGFEPGMIQKDTRAPIKNEANTASATPSAPSPWPAPWTRTRPAPSSSSTWLTTASSTTPPRPPRAGATPYSAR